MSDSDWIIGLCAMNWTLAKQRLGKYDSLSNMELPAGCCRCEIRSDSCAGTDGGRNAGHAGQAPARASLVALEVRFRTGTPGEAGDTFSTASVMRASCQTAHAERLHHSFRATGITAYLANGGALEHAQSMAAHESPRTTKLYDRTKERLTQDEVERIRL